MDIDADLIADQIIDTIEAVGSTVALPGGRKVLAVKVTNEKEMQRLLKVEGEELDKVTTVFLFDRDAQPLISKGTRIINVDGSFITEMIHTEVINDTVCYIAAGSYEAS